MAGCMSVILVWAMALLSLTGVICGDEWDVARASFYGDAQGKKIIDDSCGYGTNLFQQGYGVETIALSAALFNNGLTCGACYEIQCYNDPQLCLPGTVHVTVTNFCQPNDTKIEGTWCDSSQKHLDLSMPMFLKISQYKADIIPVQYRRIPCIKTGGIKFEIKGNPYGMLVLVYNVAGAGEVTNLKIKGSNTDWTQTSRKWGQIWGIDWQATTELHGQSLSFQVTASDGKMVESYDVAPSNWQFGQTYEGKQF